ncbi:MAG: DUF1071 domain-containing protein [Pelagibacteraceae bacterium]
MDSIWKTLSGINVNEHTELKQGMTYLSWAWAWGIVKDHYPNAKFHKHQFDGPNGKRPYMIDEHGFAFVMVTVNIDKEEQTEILPVLRVNKPIQNPTSFDINTALQRCLVKCLAMFGLGHYIYANEDLPPDNSEDLSHDSGNDTQRGQAGSDGEVVPPTDAPPSDTPKEQNPDDNYDRAFFLDMQSRLRQARHVSKVHQLFQEMKPKLSEIKSRQPERAKKIYQLFLDAEERLSNGNV